MYVCMYFDNHAKICRCPQNYLVFYFISNESSFFLIESTLIIIIKDKTKQMFCLSDNFVTTHLLISHKSIDTDHLRIS